MGRGIRARAAVLLLAFAAAACGGGGSESGGSGGGGGTANVGPVFTSSSTAQAPENAAGTVYTATATDANGDPFEFGIHSGADAALFQITKGGELSFRTPPNFEAPGDADRDNVYEVTILVGDGGSVAALALRIVVTNVVEGTIRVRRVGTGFEAPTFLTALPDNSGRVLVVERAGRIRILNPATGEIAAAPFLDILGQVSTDGERGMLSVALPPDYMASGRAYVFMTALDGSIQVRRYTALGSNRERLNAANHDVILRVPHTANVNIGGWLGFDVVEPGILNIAIGDGGDPANANRVARLGYNHFGKITRVGLAGDSHPDDPDRNYTDAGTNLMSIAHELRHYGLRNPFRASFDRVTGDLWIGDVGDSSFEEINRIDSRIPGYSFGWPRYEGTQQRTTAGIEGAFPVAQYSHGIGPLEGKSIIGGYVYRGPAESLYGQYIFADFVSNNIWSVPAASLPNQSAIPGTTASSSIFTNRNAEFRPDAGTLSQIVSFGEDQVGNLFIVSLAGSVFMIQSTPG